MRGRHFHHLPILTTDKYEIFRFGDSGDRLEYRVRDRGSKEWLATAFAEPDEEYVRSVRVIDSHRRRGIATLLYDTIESDQDITLRPDPRPGSLNPEMRAFWRKRGFRF